MKHSLSPLDAMRFHGWLHNVSQELRDAILAHCRKQTAAAGDVLYHIGDPPDGIYRVVNGAFFFEAGPVERGPQLVQSFTAGTWFGEAEIFNHRPRLGTMIASRPSSYLHLPLTQIEQFHQAGYEIWRALGVLAGAHIELALVAIDDLTIRPPRERIAAILLRMAGARLSDIPDDPEPELTITQADLAKIANTSRSTVARHLNELEADGLLTCSYGRISLLDGRALRELLAGADDPVPDRGSPPVSAP
jgi:CRP/FNR family cyclic AMP-dependent transcriptional regulator